MPKKRVIIFRRQKKRTSNSQTSTPAATTPTSNAPSVDNAKTDRSVGTIEITVKATSSTPTMIVGRQSPLSSSPPVNHSVGGSTKTTNSKPVSTRNDVS